MSVSLSFLIDICVSLRDEIELQYLSLCFSSVVSLCSNASFKNFAILHGYVLLKIVFTSFNTTDENIDFLISAYAGHSMRK